MMDHYMSEIKLLLADDDRVIVATMSEDLESAGYNVIRAYNGKEAVEKCQQESPDLAILDVRMPVMDGIEASVHIKDTTETPFIFLTAYSDKCFLEKAVVNGALGYLIKPVSAERMIPVIETALARAKDISAILNTNSNLLQAIENRRDIDITIGLIMERYNLSRQDSFEIVRQLARSQRSKIEAVAAGIVEAAEKLVMPQGILKKLSSGKKK